MGDNCVEFNLKLSECSNILSQKIFIHSKSLEFKQWRNQKF